MVDVKLYLGDCLDILKGIPDKSIDCVLTDPPYDLPRSLIDRHKPEHNRLSTGAIIVFSQPENQWYESTLNVRELQYHFWIKAISTKNTSRRPSRFVEIIQVIAGDVWNTGRHWSQYTNIHMDLVDENKFHPHVKPLSLMIKFIKNYTNPGDTILDPFMGSGTTGVACVQTGRNFIGVEIDEGYFKIAEKRIHDAQMQPNLFHS